MEKVLKKSPIIGFVRYSQKIDFWGIRDMFEPKYFEYRFQIFKDITLKSFQFQTNKNFLLVILHSENIPPHYKERFFELERDHLFLKNIFIADTAEAFEEALKNSSHYLNFQNGVALTFRIDNDDALPTNFIENLDVFLNPAFLGSCINLPNVLIVKRARNDQYLVETRYFPSNSMGLAYVTSENNFKTIFDVNQHHLVNENNNLILLPKHSGMPIQTINGENAINSINDYASATFTEKQLQEFLEDNNYATINLKCLKILNYKKRLSINDILNLLTPPIFNIIAFKINTFIKQR